MFWNQLKLAWRNLSKNRFFTILNILGLGLGMACSLLILLWVKDERSIDAFHVNRDRLYIVYEHEYGDGKTWGDYDSEGLLADELKKELPEVEYAATIDGDDNYTFRSGGKSRKVNGGFSGKDFFHLFSFKLLEGNADNALKGPKSIAISKAMATSFFGSPQAAMGKTLRRDSINHWWDFTVTAVFDDIPEHSTLKFDFLINWEDFLRGNPWLKEWDNSGPITLFTLRPDANPEKVRAKMKDIVQRLVETPIPGHRTELDLQRFDERYLHSQFRDGQIVGGRIGYVRLFSVVAVFILLIACINFMNLTTARSMKRAREIGVRKVIGAKRSALIRQFLGEAILLAALATILSLLLASLLLPAFNSVTGKKIQLPLNDLAFWLQVVGQTFLTGCVAGSYPALFLSSFRPVKVLKGTLTLGSGASLFRKGLVVFQFVLSTVLIIGTLVVTDQINYLQTANVGYNRENLVYIPIEGQLTEKFSLFKEEALKLSGIQAVSCTNNAPTAMDNGTVNMDWDGKRRDYAPSFTQASVGYDYTRVTGIRLLAGRDFSRAFPADTNNYILNEVAVEQIGYKNPVGRNFTFWDKKGKIIGVIKNFHFASLHDKVRPLVLRFNEHQANGAILVKIASGQTKQVLHELEQLCKGLNPAFPFTYQFSDEQYQKFYASEAVIGQLSHYFAIIAILISCMGLLGLTLYTAEQRTKEIGIRKVLGAGAAQLFVLLSRDFLLLVLLAFAIATPLALWATQRWLGDYAYHINPGPKVFLLAGFASFAVAMLTVSYHSLRTAHANPVRSLRAE